jgi:AcrR family transcriptional regulator
MEKQESRERILAESVGMFLQFGFKSVTMDDIARHLSISKKTIYQHFRDKDEIIKLATEYHIKHEIQEVQTIQQQAENVIEELFMLSRCIREKLKSTNLNVLYELQKHFPAAWQVYQKFKEEVLFRMIVDNLTAGIEQGYFRKEINADILARLRMEEIQIAFNRDIFPAIQFEISTVHEQFFNHFIHGILTAKGLETYNQYLQTSQTNA